MELADAAIRTQTKTIRFHPTFKDESGTPVRISAFDGERMTDADRWCDLAGSVLQELDTKLGYASVHGQRSRSCDIWLVIADDASRLDMPADLNGMLREAVNQFDFPVREFEVIRGGHAAGVLAVRQASAALARANDGIAIILAINAGIGDGYLRWLHARRLLHGAHHRWRDGFRANPYGRTPGECAAAIALSLDPRAARGAWARIVGCETVNEPVTRSSDLPCTGEGMGRAARAALQAAQQSVSSPPSTVMTDLNGEPYRADQFGFTAQRLSACLPKSWRHVLPAIATGDIGTATSIAHVALASYAIHVRAQSSPYLVLSSSDDELRGAVVLAPMNAD